MSGRARRGAATALALFALAGGATAGTTGAQAPSGAGGDLAATSPPWVDAGPPGRPLDERLEEIRQRVENALVYPQSARWRDLEGAAIVEFEIGIDGRARGLRLARSSGVPSLDRAALRAVERAGVLPYVYGRLTVPVHFQLGGPR